MAKEQKRNFDAIFQDMNEQRYIIVEVLRSDIRLGNRISDYLKREMQKMDALQAEWDEYIKNNFNREGKCK